MAEPNTTFSDAEGLPPEAMLVLSDMDREQMEELIRLAEEEEKKKEEMLSSLAGEIEAKFELRLRGGATPQSHRQ